MFLGPLPRPGHISYAITYLLNPDGGKLPPKRERYRVRFRVYLLATESPTKSMNLSLFSAGGVGDGNEIIVITGEGEEDVIEGEGQNGEEYNRGQMVRNYQ